MTIEPQPYQERDTQELCDFFHVEQRHVDKLNELMKDRLDTWDEDAKGLAGLSKP